MTVDETFLQRVVGIGYRCVSIGSSLKFCLVAEGDAHFYPRLGTALEWHNAAHAVVNAAGGAVCGFEGNELHCNKAGLHNPELLVMSAHDIVLRVSQCGKHGISRMEKKA